MYTAVRPQSNSIHIAVIKTYLPKAMTINTTEAIKTEKENDQHFSGTFTILPMTD